jgi:hypothetical protein
MPFPITTWRTNMRNLFAVCRRLDGVQADDLIGVVGLFALIPLILSIGGAK